MTTVSVIVPCYNGRQWIEGCLQSLADQHRPAEEIVVVDDGSTDGSADRLAEWRERLPSLKVVSQPNRGLSAARNAGIAEACGELLALLDVDDRFEPTKLDKQVAFMEEHPQADIGLTDFTFVDEDDGVLEPHGLDRHPLVWKQQWTRLGQDRFLSEDDSLEWMVRDSYAPPSVWMIRATSWQRIGPFDETIRNGEDQEYLVRCLKAGARLGLLREPLSRITMTPTSMCRGNRASWEWRIALTRRYEHDYRGRLTRQERRALRDVRKDYQLGLAYQYYQHRDFIRSRKHAWGALASSGGWTAWKYLLKTLPGLRLMMTSCQQPSAWLHADADLSVEETGVNLHQPVLFMNHYATLGGGELAMWNHVVDLQRRGLSCAALLHEPGPFMDRLLRQNIETLLLHDAPEPADGWRKHHRALGKLRALQALQSTRPAAIWCYTLAEWLSLGPILHRLGFLLLYRSQAELSENLRRGFVLPWQIRQAAQATRCIATTTRQERDLLLRFNAIPPQVQYIPLGIDTDRFHPAPREETPTVTLGMFGRLIDWKGHDVLLHALERCGTDLPWRLMIVGDATSGQSDYERNLRDLAGRLGLGDRIDWLGFREDVPELMRQCDILVHCSHREPFGLVIAEGMASGLCVLATDVSGPREIITHGKDGLLYPPGDVETLSRLLRDLMEHPARRSELARNARPAIERSFSLQSSMDALWDLTRQAVEEKRRP